MSGHRPDCVTPDGDIECRCGLTDGLADEADRITEALERLTDEVDRRAEALERLADEADRLTDTFDLLTSLPPRTIDVDTKGRL